MNILITGADGFLGKNLIERLVRMDDVNIMHYSLGTSDLLLEKNLKECDFLFHFADIAYAVVENLCILYLADRVRNRYL